MNKLEQATEQKNWNQLTTDEKANRLRKRVKELSRLLDEMNTRTWQFKEDVRAEAGECYF